VIAAAVFATERLEMQDLSNAELWKWRIDSQLLFIFPRSVIFKFCKFNSWSDAATPLIIAQSS